MADYTKAFEVEEGIILAGAGGVFSGSLAPDFDAPVGSFYLMTNGTQYTKTSAGAGSGAWTLNTSGGGGGATTNLAVGARIIPVGQTWSIDANYESVVTRRMFCLGRLTLAGRITIIF